MSAIKSYSKGLLDATLRPQAAFILWLVNAAFAAAVYFPAAGSLSAVLSRSLAGGDFLKGTNVDALLELFTGSGEALGMLGTTILVLLGLYLFVSPFLYGGILQSLIRPRGAEKFATAFWAGGGTFYGRFFRLSLASIFLWIPAAIVFLLANVLLDAAAGDPLKEQLNFILTIARVVVALLLFFLVKMILDYARIRLAVGDLPSAVAALFWAAGFTLRRLFKTLFLYYLLGLTALAGFFIYLGLQSLLVKSSTFALLAGLLITQLHIFWRSWIKVAYQAVQLRFYTLESF